MNINSVDEAIDFIKSDISIETVVNKYITLQKANSTSFKGLCPFHNEKTPSFYVNYDKKIYKCFGCGESGDVIKFVQDLDKLNFIESIKKILSLSNISFSFKNNPELVKTKDKKEKIYKIYKEAVNLYKRNLLQNKEATEYLKKRKVNLDIINIFNIGLSTSSSLIYNELKNKYNEKDILDSGICIKSNNNIIRDFFFNRIIFPIKNINGNFIGFGGRATTEDSKYPKYINSKENLAFKKSNILFNFDMIKVMPKGVIPFIVEGYMDVISMYRIGYKYSFAPLGTSITIEQIKLLFQYSNKIAICFDSDEAGQKASIRACKMIFSVMKESNEVIIINLTQYGSKDIDEYLNSYESNQKNIIDQLLQNGSNINDFVFNYYTKNKNLKNLSEKIKIEKELYEFSNLTQDSVIRDNYKRFFKQKINESYYSNSKKKLNYQNYNVKLKSINDIQFESELNILSFMIFFYDKLKDNNFYLEEEFTFLHKENESLMKKIIQCQDINLLQNELPEIIIKKIKQISMLFDKENISDLLLQVYMKKLTLVNKLERNKLDKNFNSIEESIIKNEIFEINEKLNSLQNQ